MMETNQERGQGERSAAGRVQVVVSGILVKHLPSKGQSVRNAVKNEEKMRMLVRV